MIYSFCYGLGWWQEPNDAFGGTAGAALETARQKRVDPPTTPSKKSPEKKIPKLGEGQIEDSQQVEETLRVDTPADPLLSLPAFKSDTGGSSDTNMLAMALEKIAALEAALKDQQQKAEPAKATTPCVVAGNPRPKPKSVPKAVAAPVEARGDESGADEDDDENENGDDDDMIVMPTGSKATQLKPFYVWASILAYSWKCIHVNHWG